MIFLSPWQNYLSPLHFSKLGQLYFFFLVLFSILYFIFTFLSSFIQIIFIFFVIFFFSSEFQAFLVTLQGKKKVLFSLNLFLPTLHTVRLVAPALSQLAIPCGYMGGGGAGN